MADRVTICQATVADVAFVAQYLRAADRAELQAMHGPDADIVALLAQSAAITPELLVAADASTGEPLCVFGVAPIPGTLAGCPWMLGTERLQGFARELIVICRAYVDRWAAEHVGLGNFVHAENTRSIRWLQALGFTVGEAVPVGPHGGMFRPFERVHVTH